MNCYMWFAPGRHPVFEVLRITCVVRQGLKGGDVRVGDQAFEEGYTAAQIHDFTKIDPWFVNQLEGLHKTEEWLKSQSLVDISAEDMFQIKRRGFSDPQIARCTGAAAHVQT